MTCLSRNISWHLEALTILSANMVDDVIPEIHLFNSHNRTSCLWLHAGFFRCICENGMTVSIAMNKHIKIRHRGHFDINGSINAVIETLGHIEEFIDSMKGTTLTDNERYRFAKSALAIYPNTIKPMEPEELLRTRRYEDMGNTLWVVLNVIQENMIKGGLLIDYEVPREDGTMRRKTGLMREITNITKKGAVNMQLWQIAIANFLQFDF
jgi:hypothetical protein